MINLDAFNLRPGAAFSLPHEEAPRNVWVAERVSLDLDAEIVYVWVHEATERDEPLVDRAFVFEFCEKVRLRGLVVNPSDPNDSNWGAW